MTDLSFMDQIIPSFISGIKDNYFVQDKQKAVHY